MRSLITLTLSASWVAAYPFMGMPDEKFFPNGIERRQFTNDATCPTRSDHTGAVPFNEKFPYLGANPLLNTESTGKGGILVPAEGDVDHEFRAPGPNDIRGPCPGLNAAANHGFLSRDGIVTYNELVAAQQNMFNVGFRLANLLATFGVSLDGDVATQKMSLGCDATSRTALLGGLAPLLQKQPGLNGHNKFESDTSLTRNDYYLSNGDNFNFNGTLFKMMSESTNNDFTRKPLAKYRAERWRQSRNENANFFFGPGALLLYGAASFLYELFPGSSHAPDLPTMMSFFGAADDGNGGYKYIGERAPPGWRNRVKPYDLGGVGQEIVTMYGAAPQLFGANTGKGDFLLFKENGQIGADLDDADSVVCALFQLATAGVPSMVSGIVARPLEVLKFAVGQLAPFAKEIPCPLPQQ